MLNNLLYIAWQPDEYLVRFGSMGIRWYGMCWLVGFAVAYFLMRWLFKRHKIADEKFDPMFVYVFLGAFIGARLGHCFFYEPQDFFDSWQHFVEIFLPIKFLAGGGWKFVGYQGLASHGGVIGLLVGLYLYIKRTKLNAWVVLDFMGICSTVTSVFIRLGNLMNSEIIGKVTDVPWAFIFERVDQMPRHPGQLYEAIAYFIFFFIGLWLYRKWPNKVGTGYFFGFCLTTIFTSRLFVEYFKEVQEPWEQQMQAVIHLNQGQLLSLPFIAIGLYCLLGGKLPKAWKG